MDARTMNQTGQSLIEILLAMPLMVGLFVVLVRTNTVIQMSIVNQKYARAQTLYLTHFNANYPRRGLLDGLLDENPGQEKNRMTMGVADNVYSDPSNISQVPLASKYRITRTPNRAVDSLSGISQQRLSEVRIYNTVALCAPSVYAQGPNGLQRIRVPGAPNNLSESTRFSYCYSYQDQGGSVP